LQTHGNNILVSKFISILSEKGARQSLPGEFSKQAFENGKIDLSQSVAINTLINSNNEMLVEQSTKSLSGEQTNFINGFISDLSEIISRMQVAIDYPENTDLPKYSVQGIKQLIIERILDAEKVIEQSNKLIKVSKGVSIAIVGVPNAGKSTLLNAISKEDRAIVSDIAGTTRDVVEQQLYLNGIKVTLQDTAGVRTNTNDEIEAIGIEKTKDYAEKADIILLVVDGNEDVATQEEIFKDILMKENVIRVASKSLDINGYLTINAKDGKIENLIEEIESYIKFKLSPDTEEPLLISKSQSTESEEIISSLNEAKKMLEEGHPEDIVMFELENALVYAGNIIGKTIDQEYMTNLFANFCIGK